MCRQSALMEWRWILVEEGLLLGTSTLVRSDLLAGTDAIVRGTRSDACTCHMRANQLNQLSNGSGPNITSPTDSRAGRQTYAKTFPHRLLSAARDVVTWVVWELSYSVGR